MPLSPAKTEDTIRSLKERALLVLSRLLGHSTENLRSLRPEIKLEAVLAAMSDAVVITDNQGFFIDFNESFAHLNRFKTKRECARALSDYKPTFEARLDDGRVLSPDEWPIQRALRGESRSEVPLTVKRNDTGEEWVALHTFAPILDHSGAIVGAVLTGRDITEDRKAEKNLQNLSSRLDMALKSARLGVWEWDIKNDQLSWDDRMFELYGLTREQFGARVNAWEMRLHPDDRQATMDLIQDSLNGSKEYDTLFRIVLTDGEMRYLKANGVVLRDPHNRPERMLGVNADITEEVLAKERLQRAYDEVEAKVIERTAQLESAKVAAENANKAKDLFLATLSHELRSPLSAILSWAQLMERGALSPEKMQVAIRTIKDSVWAQNQLIGDLLDLSRISTGKFYIDRQPTSVLEVLRAAIDVIRPNAEQRGIKIEESFGLDDVYIGADPARLKQSFWNILSNALKFTPPGGTITISVKCVQEGDSQKVKVSFKDTGRGIKAEFIPHLFERFSQADPSSIRVHGGMGLGLALVKSLVELQNGTISAESAGEGLGATFTMTFPLIAQSGHELLESMKTPETTGVADGHDLHNIKVLLVEDGEKTRVALAQLLSTQGATVQAEPSAKDALEAFPKFSPDVLVSDIAMPQEDGHSLMRKIRALGHDRGGDTPAIALTAYAEPRDRDEAFASGFQEYMNKPVDAGALAKTILKLAHGHNLHPSPR